MTRALITLFALSCSSCTPATLAALGPALEAAITEAGDIVREHTGHNISEYPTTCEYEFNPRADELLLLCTVKLVRMKP